MKHKLFLAATITHTIIYTCLANADFYTPTVSRSLGGGGVAAISGPDGAFLNPAVISQITKSQIGFYHNNTNIDSKNSFYDFSGVLVDTDPEAISPGALTYVRQTRIKDSSDIDIHDIGLHLGKYIDSGIAIGLSARYFMSKIKNSTENNLFNTSLGFLFTPVKNLGFGIVSYNNFDYYNEYIKPSIQVGTHYAYQELLFLRFDVNYPLKDNADKKAIYMFGSETKLIFDFFFRLGLKIDDWQKKNFASIGTGWNGPRMGFDYAFEKNTRVSEELTHSIDLRIVF